MKHSTFRKSTLISSIALLLVAIVALSGATFAWFSTKADAKATGINATTSKGSALVLSKSSEGPWDYTIDLSGTNELAAATIEDVDAKASAEAKVVTWNMLTSKAASYDSQAATTWSDAVEGTDYYKKTIYVKYDGDAGTTKELKADLIFAEGAVYSAGADYYRVALVPTGDNVATSAPLYKIYSISNYNRADSATYGDYADKVTTTATNIELGTLTAGTVYAYDLYVWFEGEDTDCIDSNSVNNITVDVSFK